MNRFLLAGCMVVLTMLLSSCSYEQEFPEYKQLYEFDSYWGEPIISLEGELIGGMFSLYLALNHNNELQYVYFLDNHDYDDVPNPVLTISCDDDSTPHRDIIYNEFISKENPNTIDYNGLNQCLGNYTRISITPAIMSSYATLPEPLNMTITIEEFKESANLISN